MGAYTQAHIHNARTRTASERHSRPQKRGHTHARLVFASELRVDILHRPVRQHPCSLQMRILQRVCLTGCAVCVRVHCRFVRFTRPGSSLTQPTSPCAVVCVWWASRERKRQWNTQSKQDIRTSASIDARTATEHYVCQDSHSDRRTCVC